MKIYRWLLLILAGASLMTCTDDAILNDANVCSLTDSFGETHWISELKNSITNCFCETAILKGTYAGQTVFFVSLTDPLCNGVDTPTLYNCEGKAIRTFTSSPDDQEELLEEVTRDSVVYRCTP